MSAVGPEDDLLAAPFVPAGAEDAGDVFTCALCGLRFTHGERACGGCPLGAGCDLVRCPGCGFQTPRSSRLVEWWRRLRRRSAGR